MRFPILTTLLTSLASIALADVEFTTPAAGASLVGGTTISIAWKESGTSPAITTFSSYQLFLMAGGNTATSMIQLSALVSTGTFATNAASGTVSTGLGASTKNAYFLKMISVSKEGGTVINYSDRFTLTGMDGTFPAAVIAGITAVGSSTAGPATENDVSTGADTTAAGAAGGEFTVAYGMQTGLTKYAPMQPVPPTKITAKSFTPLNPTSAFTIATTYLPIPTIVTTLTLSQTFSVSSMENTVAAASQPTGDMAKFLNRWKD